MEKATSYIKLGSYKLSVNKCTVINREIFAILLIYAKTGEKKKSYEKSFSLYERRDRKSKLPLLLTVVAEMSN